MYRFSGSLGEVGAACEEVCFAVVFIVSGDEALLRNALEAILGVAGWLLKWRLCVGICSGGESSDEDASLSSSDVNPPPDSSMESAAEEERISAIANLDPDGGCKVSKSGGR